MPRLCPSPNIALATDGHPHDGVIRRVCAHNDVTSEGAGGGLRLRTYVPALSA
jgi:hypothetical protein